MTIWKRCLIIVLVCVFCAGCDQSTKLLASQHLSKTGMDSYFYDLLRLGYAENTGGFLGLGSGLSDEYRFVIFTVIVGLFLLGFLLYLVFSAKQNHWSLIALSLVFAGGSSNFFDRAVNNGVVVDFLNIGIGSVRTGIFNIADIAILVGCLLLFLTYRSEYDREDSVDL